MIRIDLSKEEALKKGNPLSQLLRKMKFKAPSGKPGAAKKTEIDSKALITNALIALTSLLPYVGVARFKNYVTDRHLENVKTMEQQVTQLDSEIAKYTAFQSELESYDKQKKLVKDRLDIVKDLLGARASTVNILDTLGQSLPARSWLLNLDYSALAQTGGLKISGQAYSNEDVSDLVEKLSESIHLEEVRLEDVGTAKVSDLEFKTFQIVAAPKVKYRKLASPPAATPVASAPAAAGAVPAAGAPGTPATGGASAPGAAAPANPGNETEKL